LSRDDNRRQAGLEVAPIHKSVLAGVQIEGEGNADLFKVGEAGGPLGLSFGACQGREQHRRQNRDNGDDDEQLDQGETGTRRPMPGKIRWFSCQIYNYLIHHWLDFAIARDEDDEDDLDTDCTKDHGFVGFAANGTVDSVGPLDRDAFGAVMPGGGVSLGAAMASGRKPADFQNNGGVYWPGRVERQGGNGSTADQPPRGPTVCLLPVECRGALVAHDNGNLHR